MRSQNFVPNLSINEQTNQDILFNIMIKLDVNHIILLWFSAKYSNQFRNNIENKIDETNIFRVLSGHTFWQSNASLHLQPQQMFGVTNFQTLMLDRNDAYKIIQRELDHSIYYKKNFYYYRTGKYEGLLGTSIKEIEDLLLKDDADGLFHKIVSKPNLLPLIKKNDYEINDVLACVGTRLQEKHIEFVGLLTCMMRLRAINCFDLFASTYIILWSSLPVFRDDISEKYRYPFIWDSISSDITFLKHYMSLTLKLSHGCRSSLSRCVNHALESEYFDLLRDSFNSMSNKRLDYLFDNCEKWEKPVSKSKLMMLFTESEHKYKKNLSETAVKTLSIKNDNNLSGNIDELIKLRSKMIDIYDQWIQELRDRKDSQKQVIFDIRPK